MKTEKLTFHQGDDYAVVMLPDQTTDAPLASVYGPDVEGYGKLFAAAPALLAALDLMLNDYRPEACGLSPDCEVCRASNAAEAAARAAIAAADGLVMLPDQPVVARSSADITERLRVRAKMAREENTGTALGDAVHFEEAATEIDRLREVKRRALAVADERAKELCARPAAPALLAALKLFVERVERFGNWDDGCFYYNGISASELQKPVRVAKAAIAAAKRGDDGATDDAPANFPAGLVMVPREPTTAMLSAGQRAWLDDPQRRSSTLYRAMIAAAKQGDAAEYAKAADQEFEAIRARDGQ